MLAAMRFLGQVEDQVDVRLSLDEIVLLRNALHELCEEMQFSDNDFATILGVQRGEAAALLRRIDTLVDRLQLNPDTY